MTDRAIRAWVGTHQLLTVFVALVLVGSAGSVLATMATKQDAEKQAWRRRHPVLAFVGDGLRAVGIDLPKLISLFGLGVALLIKLLSKDKDE